MEGVGADGMIMQLGRRDNECVLSPLYLSLREIDDCWIRAASESEKAHSMQRRQRKARTRALVRRCATLSRIQSGDVVMKYMLVMQLFRRRTTTRTYGTAPSRLEGDNLKLSEWLR